MVEIKNSLRTAIEKVTRADHRNSASMGYGYLDDEFQISHLSDTAASILGRPASEIVGMTLDTFLGEVSSTPSLEAEPVAMGEEYVLRSRAEIKNVRLFVIPTSPGERRGSSVFVIEDITQMKAAVAERESLRQVVVEEKQRWSRLFRNASHDMREPLRMVCTYIGLLKEEREAQLDETGREYLGFASDGATRLRKQTEALLRLLAFEFQTYRMGVVSMDEALACATSGLAKPIAERKAILHARPLPQAWGNAGLMADLFQALIDNALKFSAKSGPPKLEIQARQEGDNIVYTIADEGEGVPLEKLEEIFDPFRRLNPRELFHGEGLGLTICRRIVQLHGGRIWAEGASANHKGFSVHFSLPTSETASTLN